MRKCVKSANPKILFNETTKERDLNGMVDLFVKGIFEVVTPRRTRGGSKKRKSRKYKKKKVPRTHKK